MTTHHPGVDDGMRAHTNRDGTTVIYERGEPEAWIQSDYVVEVG